MKKVQIVSGGGKVLLQIVKAPRMGLHSATNEEVLASLKLSQDDIKWLLKTLPHHLR